MRRSAVARFAGEIVDVFRNRSFRVLFLTVLVFWVAQGTAGSLSVHAFRYFWELPSSVIQNILILGTVGTDVRNSGVCGVVGPFRET
jgi:GPH family glycoside/pentoside/hexuronide:cation symporter